MVLCLIGAGGNRDGGEFKNLVVLKEGFQRNTFSSELCSVEIYLALVTSILNYLLFFILQGKMWAEHYSAVRIQGCAAEQSKVNIFYNAANPAQRYWRRDLCHQFFPLCSWKAVFSRLCFDCFLLWWYLNVINGPFFCKNCVSWLQCYR